MLTVGKLKKKLKGIPDSTPIYTADHDHSSWETNGLASQVEFLNQNDMSDMEKEFLEEDPVFKIKGSYVVIRV